MSKTQEFVIVRTILGQDTGTLEVRDVLAVSPTLMGAKVYGEKLIKSRTGQDVFFEPSGWGRMEAHYYGESGALNMISIYPVARVTQATKV